MEVDRSTSQEPHRTPSGKMRRKAKAAATTSPPYAAGAPSDLGTPSRKPARKQLDFGKGYALKSLNSLRGSAKAMATALLEEEGYLDDDPWDDDDL